MPRGFALTRLLGLAPFLTLAPACTQLAFAPFAAPPVAAASTGEVRWHYFDAPGHDDIWSEAVSSWQRRVRAGAVHAVATGAGEPEARPAKPQPASGAERTGEEPEGEPASPRLADAYAAFHQEQRRGLARSVATWIQQQSLAHFIADGTVDRWGTFEEVMARNGDDCDGLSLLAYRLLRGFGFVEGELYQAIVHRPADGQYHMVTLWFEEPDDPWVIDPTAAMVDEFVRMSSIEGWQPLKLFTEQEEYTVRPSPPAAVAAPAGAD